MTDNNDYFNQAGATGAGTPDTTVQKPAPADQSPNGGAEGEAREDEVITAAKLKKILEAERNENKKQQDKLVTLLDKRVDKARKDNEQAIALLKANGIPLTAEQEAASMQTAIQKAIVSNSAEELPQGSQRVEGADPIATMVNAEVGKIMKETGVYVTPEEAREQIKDTESPIDFILKFRNYCQQKANRAEPSARIPTLASTGNQVPANETLLQQFNAEMALVLTDKHPTVTQGNVDQIVALKQAYMEKGLKGIY